VLLIMTEDFGTSVAKKKFDVQISKDSLLMIVIEKLTSVVFHNGLVQSNSEIKPTRCDVSNRWPSTVTNNLLPVTSTVSSHNWQHISISNYHIDSSLIFLNCNRIP